MRRLIKTIGRWFQPQPHGNDTVEYWEIIEHVRPKLKGYYDPFTKKDGWY